MELITSVDMAVRLGAALTASTLLGWERESRARPAGLRTIIITCVAAATAMILSEFLFIRSDLSAPAGAWRPDPARLGAGVLTGIGFLGAGTIMRQEHIVRGVTTAATLWFVTVIGLTLGAGHFLLGATSTLLALAVLRILPHFEKNLRQDWIAQLTLVGLLSALDQDKIRQHAASLGVTIKTTRVTCDLEHQRKTLVLEMSLPHNRYHDLCRALLDEYNSQPGVFSVGWN